VCVGFGFACDFACAVYAVTIDCVRLDGSVYSVEEKKDDGEKRGENLYLPSEQSVESQG
jgi:hypothetical protein